MAKVFLSHSSIDKPFVEQLYQKLTEDGIDTFFDKESIKAGDSIVKELRQALDEFEVFICVYSPDYFDSNWGSTEWETVLMSALSGESGKRLLPLYLRECEIPTLLSDLKYIDLRNKVLDVVYPEILDALGGHFSLSLPSASPLPLGERSMVPHNSLQDSFIGRTRFIYDLHETLIEKPVVVIEGMAGVGKTQLVVEYAYRFAAEYFPGGVIWVEANGGKSALVRALRHFTGEEGIAFKESEDELEQLWTLLSGPPRELVILDNLDQNLTSIEEWLPNGVEDIRVLITTRGLNSTTLPKLRLDCFSEAEGIDFFTNSEGEISGPELEAAKQLIEMMGGLPLALELIRNFLKISVNRGISLTDIAKAIEEQGQLKALNTFTEKYLEELPTGHEKSIAGTFELILQQLKLKESLKVLKTMSLMAPDPVPEKLLKEIMHYKDGNILDDPFQDVVIDLNNLSLIEVLEGIDCPLLYSHPLLNAYVRTKISSKSKLPKIVYDSVEKAMSRTRDPEDEFAYKSLEWVLPHAEKLVKESKDSGWIILVSKHIGYHHKRHGRYIEAEVYFRQVLKVSEKEFEAESPQLASAKYHLGQILYELGKFEEGEKLLKKSLNIYTSQGFLKKHPEFVARGKAYLGKLLYNKGKFQVALKMMQEALELNKLKFAKDHPYVTFVQTNLAAVYRALGDFTQARDLLKQALKLNENRFGKTPNHRYIAKSKFRLANLYQDLGNYRKARHLFRESLDSTIENFGPDHPRTARCQYNLGNVLIEMEHFQKGIELLRSALESNISNYAPKNPNHQYIAKVRSDLAVATADYANELIFEGKNEEASTRLEEAGLLQEEAIKAVMDSFSSKDPLLTPFYINQAKVLMARGFHKRARKYLGIAQASNEKVYGDTHPYTDRVKELMEDLHQEMEENGE